MMNSGTSDFLNATPWIAAFFVVFGHIYNISINHPDVVHPNLPLRTMYVFGGCGHISLIVFLAWVAAPPFRMGNMQ
jgi:hypothetical protein